MAKAVPTVDGAAKAALDSERLRVLCEVDRQIYERLCAIDRPLYEVFYSDDDGATHRAFVTGFQAAVEYVRAHVLPNQCADDGQIVRSLEGAAKLEGERTDPVVIATSNSHVKYIIEPVTAQHVAEYIMAHNRWALESIKLTFCQIQQDRLGAQPKWKTWEVGPGQRYRQPPPIQI
jgi:hypothetical protein